MMGTDPSSSSGPTSLDQKLLAERIRHVMRFEPLTVERGASVRTVLQAMRRVHSSVALVCEGRQLVGIFNERDYLDKIAGRSDLLEDPIEAHMSSNPRTVGPDDTVADAMRNVLEEGGYRHLPVLEDDVVIGVVTARDLVKFVAELYPTQVHNLPPDLNQVMRRAEGA